MPIRIKSDKMVRKGSAMTNIQVGDVVMWYENTHSAKRTGQVFEIVGDEASIMCYQDSSVYVKPLNQLKKIQ